MRGKFIVFEGVDGSGTSTQANLLQSYIIKNHGKCILTAEPSPGPIGNMIREIHTERIFVSENREVREKELAYLFAADRFDHLYNEKNGVIQFLDQGIHVISTRYYLSSFAYHVFNDDDMNLVKMLNQDFPPADLLFFIDCPVEVAVKRIESSRKPDLNEQRGNLLRVRDNYHNALKNYSANHTILDGTLDLDSVHSSITEITNKLLT